MNSHRVDRILDAIDAGPQRTTEASYGETKEPGWCWRCLLTPVERAEQMCDDCRKWMGGETDDDPRTRARKYNFADLFASVDPDPTYAGSADALSQINANVADLFAPVDPTPGTSYARWYEATHGCAPPPRPPITVTVQGLASDSDG